MNYLPRPVVTLTSLIMAFVLACPAHADRVSVPGGTPIVLKLSNPVGSGTHHKGDLVAMTIEQDVKINGKVVFKAGTPVQATVEDVSRRFFAGIGGYLKLSVQAAESVDGTKVPLKFEKQTTGNSNMLGALLGIVCCCVFLLIPGDDVTVPAGTLYNAVTLGPVEINAQ